MNTRELESANAESNWENVVTSFTRLVLALVIPKTCRSPQVRNGFTEAERGRAAR